MRRIAGISLVLLLVLKNLEADDEEESQVS